MKNLVCRTMGAIRRTTWAIAGAGLSLWPVGCGEDTGTTFSTTTGIMPATTAVTSDTTGGVVDTTGGVVDTTGAVPLDAGVPMPMEDLSEAPDMLSQTGLFADMVTQQLGPDVQQYDPKYWLWSDGSGKRRWVRLPPGTQIDTSDMDAWRYPIGTKLWKEFANDAQVLETRYMAKYGPDGQDWVMMAYQWDPALQDAIAVPDGVKNTAGTDHDIPSDLTCLKCHEGLPDAALGFTGLQLSHTGAGLTLQGLVDAGRLTHAPVGPLTLPGDEVDQAALGYLHANCGHCHNPDGGEAVRKNAQMIFWQRSTQLGSVEETPTYLKLITETSGNLSFLTNSVRRMKSRPDDAMPPVASEFVDETGVAAVDQWVQRLLLQFPQEGLPDLSTPNDQH